MYIGILDDLPIEDNPKQAIARALFQACKLILRHWKAADPPTVKEWITQMGGHSWRSKSFNIRDALANFLNSDTCIKICLKQHTHYYFSPFKQITEMILHLHMVFRHLFLPTKYNVHTVQTCEDECDVFICV